jgi:hypothetical protein
MYRGFKGFRRPEVITDEALSNFGARSGLSADNANLYVMWTGGEYRRRAMSARSQALYALKVQDKPVRLMDWIRDAARVKDADQQIGFDPGVVRSGLFLHQGAKPCVYLALERRADGSFVAAKDVPVPDPRLGYTGPIVKGQVIIAAEDAKDAVAEVKGTEAGVIETTTRGNAAPRLTSRRRGR